MKRFIFTTIAASAAIFLAAGCQDLNDIEQPSESIDRNIITASIPENIASKVAMNAPASGKGLSLAWEAGDELTVIGETTEQFTIAEGFTAHNAKFNGQEVGGESFTILYPGQTYKAVEEINAVSYLNQTQKGNGNTDHLFYHAMIQTPDYTSLDLSGARQNGVIKFLFQLPSEANVVESVTLSATDDIFYSTNDLDGEKTNSLTLDLEDVDVSASEQMLTAYMMISWNDVALPAASKLTITVNMPDSKFEQVLTVPETGLTILSGKVNTFGLNDKSWTEPLFFGGNGTEADPYQIKSYTHLDNVRKVINAETKTWFVMVDDIDMAGKNWTMYNGGIDNVFKYDFDGNDKTISNFSMTRSGASFFGALTGGSKVHDLKFNKVTLSDVENGTNSVATVSYNIIDGTVDNVDITDITITSSTSDDNNTGTGAIASRLYKGSISNCDIAELTMNTTAERVGGIVGVNATNGNTIENCSVKNAEISGTYSVGGIIGRSSSTPAVIVTTCKLEGTNTIDGTSSVGGIIGEAGGTANISNCDIIGTTITSTGDATGGIAGYVNGGNTSINLCKVYECNINGVTRTAGVVGRIGGANASNPTSISNCFVNEVTCTVNNQFLGGICGRNHCGAGVSIYSCKVDDTDLISSYNVTAGTDRGCVGGIIGQSGGNITIYKCVARGSIDSESTNVGGIIGATGGTGYGNNNIYECSWSGDIASKGRTGGIAGYIEGAITVTDCCTAGTISESAWAGGILGWCKGNITSGVISKCYSTMSLTQIGNGIGGIIGALDAKGSSTDADNAFRGTVKQCIAWNDNISATANIAGAVIGASALKNTLEDCWRKPDMDTGFTPIDQNNVSEANPLTERAYHGKAAAAGETVSTIAQEKLGWSDEIWDFTTDLPTLKNLPK